MPVSSGREFEYTRDTITSILASIREGVIIADREGIITAANPVTELMTGILPAELLGSRIQDTIFFECDTDDASAFFEEALTGWRAMELPGGCTITPREGKARIPIAVSAAPLFSPEGAYAGVVFVLRDLTHEVNARTRQYEFLSFVSHQLRAPIGSLRLGLEMILDEGRGEQLSAETREIARDLHGITITFAGFVKELLSVTRLAEGRMEFKKEQFDVRELGVLLDQEFRRLATSNNITLACFSDAKTPLIITGDRERLLDVLRNLVANAIFYNKPRGRVDCTGGIARAKEIEKLAARAKKGLEIGEYLKRVSSSEEKDMVLVTVADTGLGIPADEQPRVFESFFRARNVVKKGIAGTGLGLSIAKSIVEHLNGRIMFESKEEKGTTFYLVFPLAS